MARVKKQRTKQPQRSNCTAEYVAWATLRHTRISTQKLRLVVDMVRGMPVDPALQTLRHSPRKGAKLVLKVLESAVANAREQKGSDVDRLWIAGAWANMGRIMYRYMPGAHGRANAIRKRMSHITVCLAER